MARSRPSALPQTLAAALALTLAATACTGSQTAGADDDTVTVGMLHSLSGTMAISEVTVRDSVQLAIDEINTNGGVLGRQIQPVLEDGASDEATFAERAQKLLQSDNAVAVFGGWTSASRKAMLPVFERNNGLLFYPVQYEGLEASDNIVYTGATTNQQIIPALDYLREEGHTSIYLVGSDYVFPRTANQIITAYADHHDMQITAEEYTPLGHTEYSTITNDIARTQPDAVFNTLNGDSNVSFFQQLRSAGVEPDDVPVLSVSVAEEEVEGIGAANIAGHLTAWNYYQTTETDTNTGFVQAFTDTYGADRVTSDPMQSAYNGVYLWKEAVEAADSFEVDHVRAALEGISIDAPEGPITVDGQTQHVVKTARIGQVNDQGLIDEIWASPDPIVPDPYLEGYDWAADLTG
ncbi:urea ABC transporter substrate-binding protein [Nocardiopsis metallicus]|uniref:Urea transport system substrate-binding protein n=1 Tax=Nocardiopsis metallicus TaxID=179819 RepID=A0A840W096_9ACTN|nr:urea ABC transporter substrate-binding protein [Nocardiopsis metallicus]MBB5490200.1 urea transport system substrate-binding protein [Nocardiopsis metallicus]